MNGQLTAETLAAVMHRRLHGCHELPKNCLIYGVLLDAATAAVASPERADDIEAIRRETLLAAADAYGPEGTDATDWLRERAEAAS